jgi:hypothetical protein
VSFTPWLALAYIDTGTGPTSNRIRPRHDPSKPFGTNADIMSLWLMESKRKLEAALKQSRGYQINDNFAGPDFFSDVGSTVGVQPLLRVEHAS